MSLSEQEQRDMIDDHNRFIAAFNRKMRDDGFMHAVSGVGPTESDCCSHPSYMEGYATGMKLAKIKLRAVK